MEAVNRMLREANALPQLVKHDEWDWHLHATTREAPLADRMGTEAAMALVDVIRSKEMDRMLVCEGEDCDAVVLDLTGTGRSATATPGTAPTVRTWPLTGRAGRQRLGAQGGGRLGAAGRMRR